MRSLLISGGNQETRQQKSFDIAGENSSEFDTKIFDTAEIRGIEVARLVVTEAANKPYDSKLTSIIVLEAAKLTKEAQNALLKILEEPYESVQIILTAPSRASLLPTVASRLTEINLPAINSNEDNGQLGELAEKTLSEKLALLESTKREEYLLFWKNELNDKLNANDKKLKSVHRYIKLILKLSKAEKSQVNKKLIDLILALEIPKV